MNNELEVTITIPESVFHKRTVPQIVEYITMEIETVLDSEAPEDLDLDAINISAGW